MLAHALGRDVTDKEPPGLPLKVTSTRCCETEGESQRATAMVSQRSTPALLISLVAGTIMLRKYQGNSEGGAI